MVYNKRNKNMARVYLSQPPSLHLVKSIKKLADYHYDPLTGSLIVRMKKQMVVPKRERPQCGARTRKGVPCQAKAMAGKERCRMHGGLSTGAKTPEGRARIAESNRQRAKNRQTGEAHTR